MASRRALHFVFKIGDRKANTKFFRDILGMKVILKFVLFAYNNRRQKKKIFA